MKKGFTLIELLIVVAIIGILAAIAVPNFLNAQTRARVAQVEANFKALSTAFELYRVDHNSYPLHDPAHAYNILNNSLTTPVGYIARVPIDIFQQATISVTKSMASNAPMELHPEPLYAPAYGNVAMDKEKYTSIPKRGSGGDLTIRFKDDAEQYAKAQGMYPEGRYAVSVGPDLEHTYPGVYNVSNGLTSRGDIIRVFP
ncbi:MAG: prepilin-type N-terminal cleavage/methylation domain-containing protein [bacterium]|nr:prepilin-type N-terminal cleavage/methylation domain-containing protein [bacterium]